MRRQASIWSVDRGDVDVLENGAVAEVAVSFSPSEQEPYEGRVQVRTDNEETPYVYVDLSGNGSASTADADGDGDLDLVVAGRSLELSGREYYVRGRGYLEGIADLTTEHVRQLLRLLDVVAVATASRRHPLEQRLIEVDPDPDRGRDESPQAQLLHVPHDLVLIHDTVIRLPVRQQEDAREAILAHVMPHLMGRAQISPEQVRAPSRLDPLQRLKRGVLELVGREGRRDRDLVLVVEGDEREAVGIPQHAQTGRHSGLRQSQLGAIHRAGSIHGDPEVDLDSVVERRLTAGLDLRDDEVMGSIGAGRDISIRAKCHVCHGRSPFRGVGRAGVGGCV